MTNKERFIELYKTNIKRPGSEKLLEYLLSPHSDFFEDNLSNNHKHLSYVQVIHHHSFHEIVHWQVLQRERVKDTYQMNYSEETIAIVSLLHDLCKINCYKKGTRNVKKDGQWIQVPNYEYDDQLPYGHGEKSVYMISGYMRLTREEAFAIRYHMGFSGNEDARNVGKAFEMFPIAFALSVADMEATYFIEGKK